MKRVLAFATDGIDGRTAKTRSRPGSESAAERFPGPAPAVPRALDEHGQWPSTSAVGRRSGRAGIERHGTTGRVVVQRRRPCTDRSSRGHRHLPGANEWNGRAAEIEGAGGDAPIGNGPPPSG